MPLAPSPGGEGERVFLIRFSPLFPLLFHSGGARGFFWLHGSGATHGSLISSTMRPHALAAPRTGHLSHGESGCGRLLVSFSPLGFWGIPRLVGLPPPCFWGVSGGLILGRAPPFSRLKSRDFGGGTCRDACGLPAPSALCILQGWSMLALCRGWVPAVR